MELRHLPDVEKEKLLIEDGLLRLCLIDHIMAGGEGLPIMKRGVDQYSFSGIEEPVLSDEEMLEFQIAETKRNLELEGQEGLDFRIWSDEDQQWLMDGVKEHINQGSITEIGRLGTEGREHASDYHDPALAGKPIEVQWAEGQQASRGMELIRQKLNMINQKTGVGHYGVPLDAMHVKPAGLYPELIADESNIYFGGRSLNQAEGKREGAKLTAARQKRLHRLIKDEFEREHGKHDFRTMDKQTKADNKLMDDVQRSVGIYKRPVRQHGTEAQ